MEIDNREAAERLAKQEELRKKLVDADVSREIYREKIQKQQEENGLVTAD
jgi:hypothetical protein